MENHQKCVFSNLFAPWQETFANAADGDGEGPFETMSDSFQDNFTSMLDQFQHHFKTHYAKKKYVFQPKIKFLEMAHTNLSPLVDREHISP